MSVNELHITVAAAPNVEFGNPRLLAHDLRLAKSAVLYADRVTLCSATAWWSSSFFSLAVSPKSDREKIQVLYELYKSIGPLVDPNAERMIPSFEKYLRLVHRNPILLTNKERKILNGFREMILSQWGTLSSEFVRITRGFGFDEIEEAVGAGLLDVYPFSEGVVESFALEYFDVVQQILGNSASHPLLDEQTSGLISAALVEGKLTIGGAASKRTKQTGLVADLFDRLPVFDVPMAELIDLREDLGRPLIAFRSKIVELSEEVESAVWDKDFEGDVHQTYRKTVEPALIEIEDELKSLRFRDFWTRRLVDKAGALGFGSTAAVALGAAVAPWAGIVGAFAGLAVFVDAGLAELEAQEAKLDRNGLYFYYKLRDMTQ